MQCLIASDNPAAAAKLRHALVHLGRSCPITNVVPLDRARHELLSPSRDFGLVLLVLPEDDIGGDELVRKIRNATTARLVVVGNANDSGRILSAVHAGADDYLDEAADIGRQLADFLRRVESVPAGGDSEGRLTMVARASGGCGGSLVAINLAVSIAQRNGSCGLLDFVLRQGDLAALLNLKPRHTLADLCRSIDKLDRKMFENSLGRHESGVHLLAAPVKVSEIEHVTAEGVARLVRMARAAFSDVVVDADHVFQSSGRQLIEGSTRLVLVMRLDFTSLRNASRLLDHWRQLQVPTDKVVLVANRAGQSRELPAEKAEAVLGMNFAHLVPDDPKTVNLSVNCGMPAVLESPRSKLAGAFRDLARDIAGSEAVATVDEPDASVAPAPSLLERLGVDRLLAAAPHLAKAGE